MERSPSPVLILDDDELHAVASVLGQPLGDEHAVSVALGTVRLRARGLLSGPDDLMPPHLDPGVADTVGVYLSPEHSLAVAVQKRNGNVELTLHRRGTHAVAHTRAVVEDGEWHSFSDVPDPVGELVRLLQPRDQTRPMVPQQLELRGLERARRVAATGDRRAVAVELQGAGALEPLTGDLTDALLGAECIAQFIAMKQPLQSLTVLTAPGMLWTFAPAAEDDFVQVDRPSRETLREQVAQLWGT